MAKQNWKWSKKPTFRGGYSVSKPSGIMPKDQYFLEKAISNYKSSNKLSSSSRLTHDNLSIVSKVGNFLDTSGIPASVGAKIVATLVDKGLDKLIQSCKMNFMI